MCSKNPTERSPNLSPSNPPDALRQIVDALEKKYTVDLTPPRHHPSDVRFYLATGIFLAVGFFLMIELGYAWAHPEIPLQQTLDAFGLFNAAIFALLGTVLGFYFASKPE